MANYKRLLILVILFFGVAWFGSYPYGVETYYSTGIYPKISLFFRVLWGWVPFSVGDVAYFVAGVWMCAGVVKITRRLVRREWTGRQWLGWGRRLLEGILLLIIVFNLMWALNYNRPGIAAQLNLQPRPYAEDTLQMLIDSLIVKVNENRKAIQRTPLSNQEVFTEAVQAYRNLEYDSTLAFLRYRVRSVKASLYGRLGNYLGFLGYYNPFTGEAQVNCAVPAFTIPYTTCHEMAHQLGYASESEANFVGYLAAVHSDDPRFRYSAYQDLFSYANREMYYLDSGCYRENFRRLDTLVKQDYKQLYLFLKAHRNPLEPVLNKMYDGYLKANHQEQGIMSYSEVTGWLIAYMQKYQKL
jgi:hypothetical protein